MFGNLLSSIKRGFKAGVSAVGNLLDRAGGQGASVGSASQKPTGPVRNNPVFTPGTPPPPLSTPNVSRSEFEARQATQRTINALNRQSVVPQTGPAFSGPLFESKTRGALPKGAVQSTIDRFALENAGQSSRRSSGFAPGRGGTKKSRGERIPVRTVENGVQVFYDRFGKRFELSGTQGAAGLSSLQAFGGSGRQTTTPQFATPGQTGGSSSFTGTLGSAGGLGGTTLAGGEEEGEDGGTVSSRDIQATIDQFSQEGLQTILPPRDTLSPSLTAAHSEPGIGTASIGNQFNAGVVGQGLQGGPVDRTTIGDALRTIEQNALTIKSFLDQSVPEESVQDSIEQLSFIEQSGDPFGISQAMDNFRRSETDLIKIQNQITEVFNGITAVTQSYEAVYEDIRANPDLPKGLAQRRLEQLYGKEKGVLDNLTSQLQQLQMMKDDQNQLVNRAFDIVQSAEDREQQEFQNRMQLLNFYINSGAIGGFSDRDLKQASLAFGVGEKGLRHVRDTKLKDLNKRDLRLQKLDNGDLVIVDMDRGSVVSNLGGRAPKAPKGAETEQPVGSIDIQRFTELYPNAGVRPGDTLSDIQRKVGDASVGDLRETILDRTAKGQPIDPGTMQQLFPELNSNQIAAGIDMYGGGGVSGQNVGSGTIGSFFSKVFGPEGFLARGPQKQINQGRQ